MNIVIINQYAIPPSQIGGTRHFDFAQALTKLGHSVTIISGNYNHYSEQITTTQTTLIHTQQIDTVNFTTFKVKPYTKKSKFSRLTSMLTFARNLGVHAHKLPAIQNADAIIASSPQLFAALASYFVARKQKTPYLLEIRDLWPETLIKLGKISKYHPLCIILHIIEKYLYKHADRVITLLNGSAEYIAEHGADKNRIICLPNAVPEALIQKNIPATKNEKFTFTYAGSHGLANSLETIIEAAKILKERNQHQNITINFIGDGENKQQLISLSQQYKLDFINFLEPLTKHEIFEKLTEADAYIIIFRDSPLYQWGISPNKLYDYMALAKPVILGVNTQHDPIKISQGGISIPPENPLELANAMTHLVNLTFEQHKQMGANGRKYIQEHHNIATLAQQLLLTIESITSETKERVHAET